ncbi:MAG: CYTH domain-containing protein [Ruminococcus sp.]|nr:CYTH domain-containing protein [Ruminococcus sp.]
MKNKNSLEIEYKFLIKYPDIKILELQPEYNCYELLQLYLNIPKGTEYEAGRCRIRKVKSKEGTSYIKTFKRKLTEMTRIEIEEEITEREFAYLSRFIAEEYSPISKERHSFCISGFTYEVDVFPFWSDRAYLEIEVESENVKPPIPDFITIIKDVTFDKRYRNSALAQNIITEPLD